MENEDQTNDDALLDDWEEDPDFWIIPPHPLEDSKDEDE